MEDEMKMEVLPPLSEEEKEERQIINSQRDRELLQIETQKDLLSFMRNFMEKISAESKLKKLVEEEIEKRLQDPEEEVTMGALISILELLSKQKNEGAIGLLNVMKESQKININVGQQKEKDNEPARKSQNDLSAEDVGFLKDLKKIVKSEQSEDELKKKRPLFGKENND